MNHLETIKDFLSTREIAVAGASRNPKKFGGAVLNHLLKNDFTVYPINPNTDFIGEAKCYRDVSSLPENVDRLLILTPKKNTKELLSQAVAKGIDKVWIQQRSETDDALAYARENRLDPITKECILMYAEPVSGPHKFHRFLKKLFGSYPK